jgi:hypothetical protein
VVPFSQHNPCANFLLHPDSEMKGKQEITTKIPIREKKKKKKKKEDS